MTNPLDDLIAGAAADVVTRPQDREPDPITLGDGEGAAEVTETALEAELAGLESVLTSPEFLQLLDLLSTLDVSAGEVDADGHVGRWIAEMDSVVDSIRSDATTMATMIRDELIPAVATMRGTLNEVQNARAAADIATAPMAPGVQANAAYEQLRRVQASQGMYAPGPQTAWGEDPQRDMQRAYATIAGLPSAMDHLVTDDYNARATTTATAGAASYPVSPAGQTQVSSGSSTTYAPSPTTARPTPSATAPAAAPATAAAPTVLSPAARAVAGAGAIAHGVSKGLRGETGSSKSAGGTGNGGRGRSSGSGGGRGATGSSRGMTRAEIEQAAKDAARKLDTTKARTGAAGTAGKGGGVSKAELMKMIEDAKKRVASERKPVQRGVQRAGRAASPRATTLDAMRAGKEGEGAGSPKFLDVATTTPGVARPDSETSGSKTAAAAAGSSAGGAGGGRGMGMGMMPMGGMMGAMNRMGQGGPGGPGGPGGGGSSVEVPTDYNLDEVGKRSVDSVAGGVIRSAGPVPDDDDIVSPIQRAAEEPEGGEDKSKKRGLGNIFG